MERKRTVEAFRIGRCGWGGRLLGIFGLECWYGEGETEAFWDEAVSLEKRERLVFLRRS